MALFGSRWSWAVESYRWMSKRSSIVFLWTELRISVEKCLWTRVALWIAGSSLILLTSLILCVSLLPLLSLNLLSFYRTIFHPLAANCYSNSTNVCSALKLLIFYTLKLYFFSTSRFGSTVGQFVLAASLRIQANPQGYSDFPKVSPERWVVPFENKQMLLRTNCEPLHLSIAILCW